jgi:lactate dehydrogenase-like 2-hydroxyacid dehydrogenase
MARGFRMRSTTATCTRCRRTGRGRVFHAEDARFLVAIDVLSMHMPGGEATRKWLNADRLSGC